MDRPRERRKLLLRRVTAHNVRVTGCARGLGLNSHAYIPSTNATPVVTGQFRQVPELRTRVHGRSCGREAKLWAGRGN
jgi:hypothetical protein